MKEGESVEDTAVKYKEIIMKYKVTGDDSNFGVLVGTNAKVFIDRWFDNPTDLDLNCLWDIQHRNSLPCILISKEDKSAFYLPYDQTLCDYIGGLKRDGITPNATYCFPKKMIVNHSPLPYKHQYTPYEYTK